MAEKTLKTRIQLKNETAENWGKATNFTPKQGEMIVYNYDIPRLKIGDGSTNVNSLSFLDENFVFKTTTINSKPLSGNITLTKTDLGLGNVGNFKAVSTVANQGLTSSEKSAARANIGAGTSSFSGDYDDLTNKPTIPNYSVATSTSNGLMSSSDKSKLDGIAVGANKYTHPTYTAKSSGLYKVTIDATGHVSATTAVTKADITALGIPGQDTNTTYSAFKGATSSAVGGNGLVPAPAAGASNRYLRSDGTWQIPPDTNTTYGVATTSTNGLMSASDKTKLDGIATGANKYTHPTYTTRSSGLYKVTVDATGHVSAAVAVTKADITALGIPAQDTTYTNATTSKAGLMSSTDKAKLDNISTNALLKTGDTMSGNLSFKFSTISDCAGIIDLSQNSSLSENCLSIRLMNNNFSTIYSNLKLLKDYWYVTTPYLGQLSLMPAKGSARNYSQLAFYNSRKQVGVLLWGPEGAATAQDTCQFTIRLYSYDGTDFLSTYEQYYLPNADKDLTSNKTYHILTTKKAVTIAQGGTGASSAAQAISNLGITATAAELNYCDGVTSNIQTQLDSKAPFSHTHTGYAKSTHTHIGSQIIGLSASRALVSNSSGQVAVAAVTSTELGYLDGVTSNIQNQLNAKVGFTIVASVTDP